jgi:FlaA1/EpsC-like NDP-sugar epimerase
MESNPLEAVRNNAIATRVTAETAAASGCERFVLVSTDKAVRPTNVMGASKRITELLLQTFQGNGTRLMAVRFGNVVGSSGSVIPIFRRQIEQGGPVTVTHPDVTRYFMTIPEASRLILQAGAMGEGGEIFILKMGTPVRIAEMARDLIRLHGKEPGKDIDIVYSGLRDGEKLYEELISADEGIVSTKHEKIMVLKANGNGHQNPVEYGTTVHRRVKELCEIGDSHDGKAIKSKLREIVPEYMPQESKSVL